MEIFENFSFILVIDLLLVGFLFFQLYKLIKGTVAINIFLGIASIYLIWILVKWLELKFLSVIIGQFMGIGVLILVIVFQKEIRNFLILIGKGRVIKTKGIFKVMFKENEDRLNVTAILKSSDIFSKSKTGAIIVIAKDDELDEYIESGVQINAEITVPLLDSIFYKNSPLHDGAVIIKNNKIIAARCILPITNDDDFPGELGMRHRAAVGISENSDSISVLVSEQTGTISMTYRGKIKRRCSDKYMESFLNKHFKGE